MTIHNLDDSGTQTYNIDTYTTEIGIEKESNKIESSMENGKKKVRKKFTRTRKTINLTITLMPEAVFQAFEVFYGNVELYASFNWTDPITSDIYTVRIKDPIKFTKRQRRTVFYDFNLVLEEV